MTTWPFPQEPLTFHSLSRKQLNFLTEAWQKKLQRQFPLSVQTDAKCKSLRFQDEDILPQWIHHPASLGAPRGPTQVKDGPSSPVTLTWVWQLPASLGCPKGQRPKPRSCRLLSLTSEHPTNSPSQNPQQLVTSSLAAYLENTSLPTTEFIIEVQN